jgi:WD40 repeat protein
MTGNVIPGGGDARVWSARTGDPLTPPLKHARSVASAAFSPDGERVVTFTWVPSDGSPADVRLWEAATGKAVTPFLKQPGGQLTVKFTPDGGRLLTRALGAGGTNATLWDATTGQALVTVTGALRPEARPANPLIGPQQPQLVFQGVELSPDGRRLVAFRRDEKNKGTALGIWDTATGLPVGEQLTHAGAVQLSRFSPTGDRLVTVGPGEAHLWSLEEGESLGALPVQGRLPQTPSAVFSSDGSRLVLVTAADQKRSLCVCDSARLTPLGLLPLEEAKIQSEEVFVLAPDARHALLCQGDSARLVDLAGKSGPDAALDAVLLKNAGKVSQAWFTDDGRRLLTAADDGALRVWDVLTARPLSPTLPHQETPGLAVLNRDGSALLTITGRGSSVGIYHWQWPIVRLWALPAAAPAGADDLAAGQLALGPDGRPTRVLSLARRDGRTVVEVRDAATSQLVTPPWSPHEVVLSAVLSPDGKRVATVGGDRGPPSGGQPTALRAEARVWDAVTGRPLTPPLMHTARSARGVVSAKGDAALLVDEDGAARLWLNHKPSGPLMRVEGGIQEAWFGDDRHDALSRVPLFTRGKDGAHRVWSRDGEPLTPTLKLPGRLVGFHGGEVPFPCVLAVRSDGTASVKDGATGAELGPAVPHGSRVLYAGLTADGLHGASVCADGTATIWNVSTGRPVVPPLRLGPVSEVRPLNPVAAAALLVIGEDGAVRVLTVPSGRLDVLPMKYEPGMKLTARDSQYTVGTYDHFILSAGKEARLWRIKDDEKPEERVCRHDADITAVQMFNLATPWDLTARQRGVTADRDGTTRVWDMVTGKMIAQVRHSCEVVLTSHSDRGTYLLTVGKDGSAQVWNSTTGEPVTPYFKHGSEVTHALFLRCHEGRLGNPAEFPVLTVGTDRTARVWDGMTGRPVGQPVRHDGDVTHVLALPGTEAAVVTATREGKVTLWRSKTGAAVVPPFDAGGELSHLLAVSQYQFVTVTQDGTARLWAADSGQPVGPPLRHGAALLRVAAGLGDNFLFTAGTDGTLKAWDAATGKEVVPPLKLDGPFGLAAQRRFTRVVLTVDGAEARLWDGGTGQPLLPPLKHDAPIRFADFDSTGRSVFVVTADGLVRCWDAHSGVALGPPGKCGGSVKEAGFLDRQRAYTVAGNEARAWSPLTGVPLGALRLDGEIKLVRSHGLAGLLLITATEARLWGRTLSGETPTPPIAVTEDVTDAWFDYSSVFLVSGNILRVYNATTGKLVAGPLKHDEPVLAAAYRASSASAPGVRVLTVTAAATCLWDGQANRLLLPPVKHGVPQPTFPSSFAGGTGVGGDGAVWVWPLAEAWAVNEPGPETERALTPAGPASSVVSARFSPDGERLLTVGDDASVRVWEAATGAPALPPLRHADTVAELRFSADRRRVLTFTPAPVHAPGLPGMTDARAWLGGEVVQANRLHELWGANPPPPPGNGDVRLWAADSGELLGPPLPAVRVVFDADGRRAVIARASPGAAPAVLLDRKSRAGRELPWETQVWDLTTGKPLGPPLQTDVAWSAASLSHDGSRLLLSDLKGARVWDVATGQPVSTVLTNGRPQRLLSLDGWAETLSPDGRFVLCVGVTGGDDILLRKHVQGQARVWDVSTGEPVTPVLPHTATVTEAGKRVTRPALASFSPDGGRVVTVDGTEVRVWETTTGHPAAPPFLHASPVWHVAFSPDGARLVTAAGATVQVWDLAPLERPADELLLEARLLAGRSVDKGGGLVPLGFDQFRSTWEALQARPARP